MAGSVEVSSSDPAFCLSPTRPSAFPRAASARHPDEVSTLAALLIGPDGAFIITGSDFLMEGGAAAHRLPVLRRPRLELTSEQFASRHARRRSRSRVRRGKDDSLVGETSVFAASRQYVTQVESDLE
ncbi:hypothetical protein [Nocardia shimofusensis]|uniref:hypothetical protein n=1 Tax=Nocardia shimofusensis TaxID=228596 RepID=UPI00082FC628|nr:hypothetical protein [Nocardia shimofusensis]